MTKKDKLMYSLMGVSVLLIIIGVLFLISAAEIAPIFTFFTSINNVLIRYIIVIVTMAAGIMLFSNTCAQLSDIRLRKGFSIGITAFSTLLTIPLVYVFIAIFFAHDGKVDPIGEIMMLDKIVEGFIEWFGDGWLVYAAYSVMLVLSLVFIAVPIIMCAQTVKKCKIATDKIDDIAEI